MQDDKMKTLFDRVLTRRCFLKSSLAAGGLVVLNGLELAQAQGEGPAVGDVLVHARGERQGEPLLLSEVPDAEGLKDQPVILLNLMTEGGEVKTSQLSTLMLARLDPASVPEAMTPYTTPEGIVIFSAICTHFFCTVERIDDEGHIRCGCHGSVFDPATAGEPIDGPAEYPLVMLPVEISDEQFVVSGDYSERPYIDF